MSERELSKTERNALEKAEYLAGLSEISYEQIIELVNNKTGLWICFFNDYDAWNDKTFECVKVDSRNGNFIADYNQYLAPSIAPIKVYNALIPLLKGYKLKLLSKDFVVALVVNTNEIELPKGTFHFLNQYNLFEKTSEDDIEVEYDGSILYLPIRLREEEKEESNKGHAKKRD